MSVFKTFNSYEDLLLNNMRAGGTLPAFPFDTADINNLEQVLHLIDFIELHNLQKVNLKYLRLARCKDSIKKLNQMIGLTEAKVNMAQQILSLCGRAGSSQINSVIYGPPGCGKTTLAQILAEIYLHLGTIKEKKIIRGDRANMIAEFVGQTAVKTKKLLESALGGVLFIDEAYQLGHAADGNRCPFAYECINTINQFITEHPGELHIILAGYKKDIEQNFFAQNDGLARRFPFRYTIEGYTEKELMQIFCHQAEQAGYTVAKDAINTEIFQDKQLFEFFGGDTENLFNCCRMYHEKRMFALIDTDNIMIAEDIKRGLEMYRKYKDINPVKGHWLHMYS